MADTNSFYNYRLTSKIEGENTLILNINDVSKALHCDASHPNTFIGIELGKSLSYKRHENLVLIQGVFSNSHLQSVLDKYIRMFILCENCGQLNTSLSISDTIEMLCTDCSHTKELQFNHRLKDILIARKQTTYSVVADCKSVSQVIPNFKSVVSYLKMLQSKLSAREFYMVLNKMKKNAQYSLNDYQCIQLVLLSLIDNTDINTIMYSYHNIKDILKLFITNNEQQSILIKLIERSNYDSLINILKLLYDNGVVNKQSIIRWYNTINNKDFNDFVGWIKVQ